MELGNLRLKIAIALRLNRKTYRDPSMAISQELGGRNTLCVDCFFLVIPTCYEHNPRFKPISHS